MRLFPKDLKVALEKRKKDQSFRILKIGSNSIDFSSNDYLGFAKKETIQKEALKTLKKSAFVNGSSGSRLVSGTHELHCEVETFLADYHRAESALLYNSGYDANTGLFSAILQKGATILYDELIHASIRDGIRLSNAKAYKFKHNSINDLKKKFTNCSEPVYIAIEAVYSMDGDVAPLKEMVRFSKENNCFLIVDEAHSNGVSGSKGKGLLQELNLEKEVFARVHTFGKALGCHGAVVLGSSELRDYLINFSRPFIYTTAASLHAVATIKAAYQELKHTNAIDQLQERIAYFRKKMIENNLGHLFINSESPIQCCLISGNKQVKKIAKHLTENGFDIKAILSPTVAKGKERLRICLHSYNTFKEIDELLRLLATFV